MNLTDKRTLRRIAQALRFVDIYLKNGSRALSKELIDKNIGRNNNALGKYLRQQLLITDNRYNMYLGEAKVYQLNTAGYQSLSKFAQPVSIIDYYQEHQQELITGNFQYTYKADRYWNPIQHIPRDTRTELLAHYGYIYDYDIDQCQPTLLLQYAQRCGLKQELPAIQYLLANKHQVRQQLQQDLEISDKQVKQLINSLFNGARIGINNQYSKFSTYSLLGYDPAKVKLLTGLDNIPPHPYIKELRRDISLLWKAIAKTRTPVYITTKSGNIRRVPLNARDKSQIYRQLETYISNHISQYLEFIKTSHLRIHDGFTTNNQIDESELCDWLKIKTGYDLSITESVCELTSFAVLN